MLSARVRSTVGRLFFYLGTAALAFAAWRGQIYIETRPIPLDDPTVVGLSKLQESQLQAFVAMNGLLTTLGTAMLGALGYLLVNKRGDHPRSHELWPAFACGVFGVASLYSGYAAYEGLLYMLESEFFDLRFPWIGWNNEFQFGFLLLGVFFLSDFASRNFSKGGPRETR